MSHSNIFVAGHRGMVGSAIVRQLEKDTTTNVITAERSELDLTNQIQVNEFFEKNSIDQVYLAAAKVGGIHANNSYPAEFIYQNLMIEANVIHASHMNGIQKLLFLGSSCIYPKLAEQPINESELMNGYLEPTNEPYAIAKIAGIKLCESYNRQYGRDYRSIMPTNLYGPGDNYHPQNSHVIPGLIRRIHDAKVKNEKKIYAWGTGKVYREFLYVDDMADASIFVMNLDQRKYKETTQDMLSHINVGSGEELKIKEVVQMIVDIIGFKGEVCWDGSKPDGTKRKLINSHKLNSLGWSNKISLKQGLKRAYKDYISNIK